MVTQRHYSQVVYYNGKEGKVVVEGLNIANGIGISKDKK